MRTVPSLKEPARLDSARKPPIAVAEQTRSLIASGTHTIGTYSAEHTDTGSLAAWQPGFTLARAFAKSGSGGCLRPLEEVTAASVRSAASDPCPIHTASERPGH